MTQAPSTGDAIVEAIERLTSEFGYPPTYREIARAVGLASVSGVCDWLDRLEHEGRIQRDPERARSVRVVYSTGGQPRPATMTGPCSFRMQPPMTADELDEIQARARARIRYSKEIGVPSPQWAWDVLRLIMRVRELEATP